MPAPATHSVQTSPTVLETKVVPVKALTSYPGNPRRGDVSLIEESLRAHGQYRALVVNKPGMIVLAGNHTLQGLEGIGVEKALCHLIEVDDEEAKRIALVDNRSQDLASYDDEALATLLSDLPDLDATGYDQSDLDRLLAKLADPDPAPGEIPEKFEVLVDCEDEAQQTGLLEQLTKEGRTCRALLS